jgi:hypothetical protein
MPSKVTLNLPADIWTAQDTATLAANTLASVKLRTSRGISSTGAKFKKYSRRPLYVSKRGARLKPKGGRPSRTGRSIFYAGGYRQYKEESRKHNSKKGHSALVDLVLSGQLMNNLVVIEARRNRFKIGLTKHVQHYGYDVHAIRPYIGLTPKDVQVIVNAVSIDITNKIRRGK